MKQILKSIALVLCLGLLWSCKKHKEDVKWTVKALTPIAYSNLNMKNLLADSLYKVEADSSLTLVYSNQIESIRIDSLVPFNGKEYIERVKISEFPITTRDITYDLIGRELIKGLDAQTQFILNLINKQNFAVPAFPNLSAPADTLNADAVFTSADINTGFLVNSVTNNLSFSLSNVTYVIKNLDDNAVIGTGFISKLNPGATVSDSIVLDGKRVSGNLIYQVTNFNIDGSNGVPVLVDLDKGLFIRVVATDLKAKLLTAVFPDQDFIADTFDTELSGIGDKLLKRVIIKSGQVEIKYISTSPDTVHFTYKIWDAKQGADTFRLAGKFDPSINGVPSTGTIIQNVDNFDLLLEHNNASGGTSYNTFKSSLLAGFDSTGRLVTITENDSIRMEIRLLNIQPQYASGFFGKDTFAVGPITSDFNVFENFQTGSLEFEQINLKLHINSTAGVDARVQFDKIQGLNTKTGITKDLILNQPTIDIPAATENPLTSSQVDFLINASNSNVQDFLKNLPNKLIYQGRVFTNPNADINNVSTISFNNFLSNESSFDIDLNAEIPMKIKATDITLSDTSDMANFELRSIENIKDATISLLLDNQLPISFNIKLYVLNAQNQAIDSLVSNTPVAAAIVDASGKLISSQKQQLDYYFDNARLVRFLTSKKIYFKAVMNTTSSGFSAINVLNNLKVNLVGRFNYNVNK